MPHPDDSPNVSLLDNALAPDLFADRVIGGFLSDGNVHLTFVARRCDYSQTPNVFRDVVIGRLVMPFTAADGMARFMTDFVARMKAQLSNAPSSKTLQ